MRKTCDNCKHKYATNSKCSTCIEEFDAPLENWEPSIVAIEQMMHERNLSFEHIMEYIIFEDECVENGYTLNSLLEARKNMNRANDMTELVRCSECKHRHWNECPMYHEEWVDYDDDGYLESDIVVHDYTEDNGFCHKGERHEWECTLD